MSKCVRSGDEEKYQRVICEDEERRYYDEKEEKKRVMKDKNSSQVVRHSSLSNQNYRSEQLRAINLFFFPDTHTLTPLTFFSFPPTLSIFPAFTLSFFVDGDLLNHTNMNKNLKNP